ncbi:ROK family protein [Streptococcus oralis]|uniref:Putative ROK-family transcriptional regulator n=1 Tax=Streptococcus oralis TaxID=1303 RepID=A0A139P3J9_STROR|nr:ROK family protein [Streptococcus oralis]KXT82841.1 putative ROK-family transcriptional regulator [Streptococcus oralis]
MAKIRDLKEDNIQRVRACFYQGGNWTKTDLAQQTGISLAGTTNILQTLEASGEICFIGNASSTGGRKSKLYQLSVNFAHIGTVLLSHPFDRYQIATHAFNLAGETVFEAFVSSKTGSLAEICEAVSILLESDPLMQVLVLSFPGIIGTHGEILSSDFAHLEKSQLLTSLSALTDLPILIENDVNCAVLAYQKEHPDHDNLALLYQPDSDFAGAGLLVDGRLHRGKQGFAGEVGYLSKEGKATKEELLLQITALTAVLAPDAIAYYCPSLKTDIQMTDTGIPQDFQPRLERLTELDTLVLQGGQELGRLHLLERQRQAFVKSI